MKRRILRIIAAGAVAASVAGLAACGQSGPLYLPQKHAAPAPATSPSTTAAPAARSA